MKKLKLELQLREEDLVPEAREALKKNPLYKIKPEDLSEEGKGRILSQILEEDDVLEKASKLEKWLKGEEIIGIPCLPGCIVEDRAREVEEYLQLLLELLGQIFNSIKSLGELGNPIGVVKEIIDENTAVVSPKGSIAEILLGIPPELRGDVKEGDIVSVSGGKFISRILPKRELPIKPATPEVSFRDIGGLEDQIEELKYALRVFDPEERKKMRRFKLKPWRAILLYGPPGTGKTTLAKAVANAADVPFYALSVADLISKFLGESAKNIKKVFDFAREEAKRNKKGVILYLDEISALGTYRAYDAIDAEREVARTTEQLLIELDGFRENGQTNFEDGYVLVIASTNLPHILDSAILRRFDKKIEVPIPNLIAKAKIVEIYMRGVPVDFDVNPMEVAKLIEQKNPQATGNDIEVISNFAREHAYRQGKDMVSFEDYKFAVQKYFSSSKKIEGVEVI